MAEADVDKKKANAPPAPAQPVAETPVLPWLQPGKAKLGAITARPGERIGSKRGRQPVTGADFVRERPALSPFGRIPCDQALLNWLTAQPRALVEIGMAAAIGLAAFPAYSAWNLFHTNNNYSAPAPDVASWPPCKAGQFDQLEACIARFPGAGTIRQIAEAVKAPLKAMVIANGSGPDTVINAGSPVAIWRASTAWPKCPRLNPEADACRYSVSSGISVAEAAAALAMSPEQLLRLNDHRVIGGQFPSGATIQIWRE